MANVPGESEPRRRRGAALRVLVSRLPALLLLRATAGQNPSDPTRGVPGMTCHKGLVYQNASQSSEILADYNFNFMSELALNSR